MSALSWFCVWQSQAPHTVTAHEAEALLDLLAACPGVQAAHVLLPTQAEDPFYPAPAGSPALLVQLEFDALELLENALQAHGPLAGLLDPTRLPSLADITPRQQTMLVRRYPVADAHARTEQVLSYWVEYEGPAADANAWHLHYNNHHPALLAQFPGIRMIEIYTPAVAVCGLGLPERPCLQRNKTVFDDASAMNQAMLSPVRQLLRDDFHRLPPFEGAAHHFPFHTRTRRLGAALPP